MGMFKRSHGVFCAAAAALLLTAAVHAEEEPLRLQEADLDLLYMGEFASVHFDPDYEKNADAQEIALYTLVRDALSVGNDTVDISSCGYTDVSALTDKLQNMLNAQLSQYRVADIIEYGICGGVVTEIRFSFLPDTLSASPTSITTVEQGMAHALQNVTATMTDLEKALVLHDYLVREVDYDPGDDMGNYPAVSYTTTGVFVNRIAVCAGYATAYSQLLSEVGIESCIVSSDSMNHAWNMICLDGSWYHVDVTWDDPSNMRGGFVYHHYFLRSDSEFLSQLDSAHYDWKMDDGTKVPEANVSGAFIGSAFRPMDNFDDVGMLNPVGGLYYALDDEWGSQVMAVSTMDYSTNRTVDLAHRYRFMFELNGKLYANDEYYVYELETDGTEVRLVAAVGDGIITNFWKKLDVLQYEVQTFDGDTVIRTVDIVNGASNVLLEDDFVYIINADGTAVVDGYIGTSSELVIPASAGGCTVIGIHAKAFSGQTSLTAVDFPETLRYIDKEAFSRTGLRSLVLPDSVEKIDARAFSYCVSLTSLDLGDGLERIETDAFFNSYSIPTVTLPASLTAIGDGAFAYIAALKCVYFEGNPPQEWGQGVFERWEEYEAVPLRYASTASAWTTPTWTDPYGVSYTTEPYNPTGDTRMVEDSGYCGASAEWTLYSDGELVISGSGAMDDWGSVNMIPWYDYRHMIRKVTVGEQITNIGNYAFYYCQNLQEASLPDSITRIGNYAFFSCRSLQKIQLPDNLTSLGMSAFYQCKSLKEFNIPAGVSEISSNALVGCSSLTAFSVDPANPFFITDKCGVLFDYAGTKLVAYPAGRTAVEYEVPVGVRQLQESVFSFAEKLQYVYLPKTLTSMSISAFQNVPALRGIYVNDENPGFSSDKSGVLFDKKQTNLICYPAGLTDTSYSIPGTVKSINNRAFYNAKCLTSIEIPASVTMINARSFEGCSSLTSVILPDMLTRLNSAVFMNCSSLKEITIPDRVQFIDASAFYGCKSLESVVIPCGVTQISEKAFNSCVNLKDITILNSDAFIGQLAFENVHPDRRIYGFTGSTAESYAANNQIPFTALAEDTPIASGVCGENGSWILTRSGELIISGTGPMEDYTVTNMPWYAVRSKIRTAVISSGITTVGTNAFCGCSYLESVSMAESVTEIHNLAFQNCSSLSKINIHAGISSIGSNIFSGCTSLTGIQVDPANQYFANDSFGALFSKDMTALLCFPANSGTISYVVPKTVTQIHNNAFAFVKDLKTVEIHAGVTNIGTQLFFQAYDLQSVVVAADNPFYCSENGVLYDKEQTRLYGYPIGKTDSAFTVPESVKFIYIYAFANCPYLTRVNLPDGVTQVGTGIFMGCSALTTVNLPSFLMSIPTQMFQRCTSLESIVIPYSVNTLANGSFQGATKLTSVTVLNPETVFNGTVFDSSLKQKLTIYGQPDSTAQTYANRYAHTFVKIETGSDTVAVSGTFGEGLSWKLTSNGELVISGSGAIPDWANEKATPWYSWIGQIKALTLESGITSIGNCSFQFCRNLSSVTLCDGLKEIGANAFRGCTVLRTIHLPDSLTRIGNTAFSNCSMLQEMAIPASVNSLGDAPFFSCSSLKKISVHSDNANYIADTCGVLYTRDMTVLVQAPAGSDMTEYSIPEGVIEIGKQSFWGLGKLERIAVSSTVSMIGSQAFTNCDALVGFDVDSRNLNFVSENGVLYNVAKTRLIKYPPCSPMTAFTVPSTVTSLGSNAFCNSKNLRELHLSDGIKTIEWQTFMSCTSLETLTLPKYLVSLGMSTFGDCTALKKVEIPEGVTFIDSRAFQNCTSLTEVTVLSRKAEFKANDVFANTPEGLTLYGYAGSTTEDYAKQNGYTFVPMDVVGSGSCGENLNWILYTDGTLVISGSGAMYDWSSASDTPWASCAGQILRVDIQSGAASLGDSAFSGCTNLRTVTISETVADVGDRAFYGCSALCEAIFAGDAPETFGKSVFDFVADEFVICYTEGSSGWSAPLWNGYPAEMVERKPEYVFEYNFEDDFTGDFIAVDNSIKFYPKQFSAQVVKFGDTMCVKLDRTGEQQISGQMDCYCDVLAGGTKTAWGLKDTWVLTYDLYLESAGTSEDPAKWQVGMLRMATPSGTQFQHSAMIIGSKLYAYGSIDEELCDVPVGEWFNLAIEYDMINKVMTVFVNGVRACDPLPWNCSNTSAEEATQIRLAWIDGGEGIAYVDNFQAYNGTFYGEIEMDPILYGDTNGDEVINGKDLTLIRRHISGGFVLENFREEAADVNCDGIINGKDLTLIRRYISGGFDVTLGK